MKIMHTAIKVNDMEKSLYFYCNILGFKIIRKGKIPEMKMEFAFVSDDSGGAEIELVHYENQKNNGNNDTLDHLGFLTVNIYETIENLRSKQVKIITEPFELKMAKIKIAVIQDPNGINLEIIER
jgi:lactoylglutathione lyase